MTIRIEALEDLPITAVTSIGTEGIKTGAWKYLRPRHEDRLPPCAQACPAGNDVSRILMLAAAGDFAGARSLLYSANPLPAVLGRVCPHPCERDCNREGFGGRVLIHMLERFLGDLPLGDAPPVSAESGGRRIAVVGSGPAGLTASYRLALLGYSVDVFDDKDKPGGYLRTGIPDFRLPKEILDREISRIERAGVRFQLRTRIGGELGFEALRRSYSAVLLAVGAHKPRPLDIPGADHPLVLSGTALLEQILNGNPPKLPQTVAILGGGNTAIDVARSVLRLGGKPIVIYRRTRNEMPALVEEVEEAIEEGILFEFLAAPSRLLLDGEALIGIECIRMRLGEPDGSGRRTPERIPDSTFRLAAGCVVSALGEASDLEFIPGELRSRMREDNPIADGNGAIFAAGDMVTGEGTVAAAVGSGRRAADAIHLYLTEPSSAREIKPGSHWNRPFNPDRRADADSMRREWFIHASPPAIRRQLPDRRKSSFLEIAEGLFETEALAEARRCLSCGTCNGCMNCYVFCPDAAVLRAPDGRFEIDGEHCKGCGICAEECPRGAITLEGIES